VNKKRNEAKEYVELIFISYQILFVIDHEKANHHRNFHRTFQ